MIWTLPIPGLSPVATTTSTSDLACDSKFGLQTKSIIKWLGGQAINLNNMREIVAIQVRASATGCLGRRTEDGC